jgi:hypothetical protein
MTELIYKIMAARSLRELNDLVKGVPFDPLLLVFVDNARRRIRRIENEKRRSWKPYMLN